MPRKKSLRISGVNLWSLSGYKTQGFGESHHIHKMTFQSIYKIRDMVPYDTNKEFHKARNRPTWARQNYKKYESLCFQFLTLLKDQPVPSGVKLKTARWGRYGGYHFFL